MKTKIIGIAVSALCSLGLSLARLWPVGTTGHRVADALARRDKPPSAPSAPAQPPGRTSMAA